MVGGCSMKRSGLDDRCEGSTGLIIGYGRGTGKSL